MLDETLVDSGHHLGAAVVHGLYTRSWAPGPQDVCDTVEPVQETSVFYTYGPILGEGKNSGSWPLGGP